MKVFFSNKKAIENKIIDGVGSIDEIYDYLIKDCSLKEKKQASFLFASIYLKKAGSIYPKNSKNKFAVIYLTGTILEGEQEKEIGGESASRAIRSAVYDKRIKAIILRVESPGGTAVASEQINNEIIKAKKAGKKVIVSMGSVAGSGGYWISMNADKIIATKTTITGSIGVVGMKFNLRNFFSEWLGITFDEIQTSKSSEMFSQFHSIEKGSHIDQKWNEFMDEYYSSFKKRCF